MGLDTRVSRRRTFVVWVGQPWDGSLASLIVGRNCNFAVVLDWKEGGAMAIFELVLVDLDGWAVCVLE
jgi:hypothetical protein